jgi:SAM-dependent methyltransferase
MIQNTAPSPSPTTPPQFDARKYKETTREQWQQAAGAWHRYAPTLSAWLGPATERMLDLAGVRSGQRVLDVAAGAGEQTLAIARRVGPGGSVLASDLSPRILELAAAEAQRAGLTNVSTKVMDGEQLTLPDASVDVVVSRVGLIYFPDQHRALTDMRRVLVPGGRVAAIVYSTPERNAFFSTPVSIIRRRANLGAPPPASSSSATRSARSTKCWLASTRAAATPPGTRSRRRCARSKAPTDSKARARW